MVQKWFHLEMVKFVSLILIAFSGIHCGKSLGSKHTSSTEPKPTTLSCNDGDIQEVPLGTEGVAGIRFEECSSNEFVFSSVSCNVLEGYIANTEGTDCVIDNGTGEGPGNPVVECEDSYSNTITVTGGTINESCDGGNIVRELVCRQNYRPSSGGDACELATECDPSTTSSTQCSSGELAAISTDASAGTKLCTSNGTFSSCQITACGNGKNLNYSNNSCDTPVANCTYETNNGSGTGTAMEVNGVCSANQSNCSGDQEYIEYKEPYNGHVGGCWSPKSKAVALKHFYREVFGRNVDRPGLAFYINNSSYACLIDNAIDFLGSPEFLQRVLSNLNQYDARALVTIAYRAILNRDPDPGGLDYWAQELQTRLNQINISDASALGETLKTFAYNFMQNLAGRDANYACNGDYSPAQFNQ